MSASNSRSTCYLHRSYPKPILCPAFAWIGLIAALTAGSGIASGQSAVWQPQGATTGNIYYSGGNVGIGTASPQNPLQIVAGQASGSLSGTTAMLDVLNTNGSANTWATIGFNGGYNFNQIGGIGFQLTQVGNGATLNNADFAVATMGNQGLLEHFRVTSAGNVGIGTTTPDQQLTVAGTVGVAAVDGHVPYIDGQLSVVNSIGLVPTSNLNPGTNRWALRVGPSVGAGEGLFDVYDAWNGLSRLVINNASGNVGIGTTSPQYRLSVKGTIAGGEVIVTNTSGWSDYVFDPEYRLASLNEIAAYVSENHHLPDIPSAKEVEEKGVSVGEMQAKLLAKVEELTLHMIEAEKENKQLRDRVALLEAAAPAQKLARTKFITPSAQETLQ